MDAQLAQELSTALTREQFILTAKTHGLKVRESIKEPVVFAYVDGAYAQRVTSPQFCTRCGTGEDLQDNSKTDGSVVYCGNCCNILNGAKGDSYRSPLNDPFLHANYVPDHITQGEIFDDKMAMFRNEF